MADFFDSVGKWGPGLLQGGIGLFNQSNANKEAENRLKQAQGPLYNQTMGAAGNSLNLATSMDPKAMAADRFSAQQGLVQQSNEADIQKLQRELVAKGQSGIASHGAVAGTDPSATGQPMNPQLAALYAAQAGAKNKAAYNSLNEGEQYLNNLVNRSGMLQNQAAAQYNNGARQVATLPSKSSQTSSMLNTGLGFLKDSGLLSSAFSGLGSGLSSLFSGSDWSRMFDSPVSNMDYSGLSGGEWY